VEFAIKRLQFLFLLTVYNVLHIFGGYVWLLHFLFKEDEMEKACSTNGEKSNAYRILVGKQDGKRPLGRPRCRWVDNIKWILERWDGMDWIDLAQNRDQWWALVNTVMNLWVP
jgi:hypothetical protein